MPADDSDSSITGASVSGMVPSRSAGFISVFSPSTVSLLEPFKLNIFLCVPVIVSETVHFVNDIHFLRINWI